MNKLPFIALLALLSGMSYLASAKEVLPLKSVLIDETTKRSVLNEEELKARCGPSCLYYAYRLFYGDKVPLPKIMNMRASTDSEYDSLLSLKRVAGGLGISGVGVRLSPSELLGLEHIAIARLSENPYGYTRGVPHYVLYVGRNNENITIMDPAFGPDFLHIDDFSRYWSGELLILFRSDDNNEMRLFKYGNAIQGISYFLISAILCVVLVIVLFRWRFWRSGKSN